MRSSPSEPAPAPTTPEPEHPASYPTKGGAKVEVRDHALWTKHIRGDDALRDALNRLRGRSQTELEVDGFHGTWQKMDNGKDGRPTTGIKPVGPAQTHWHTLLRNRLGSAVTIARASTAENGVTGQDEQSFEAVWEEIQRTITPRDTIRNWSQHSGYRGNDFTIHAVNDGFVDIESPGAANIQHIDRDHFARVHEHWNAYNAGVYARSRLRDITRFSTYVISILHHVLDSDRA